MQAEVWKREQMKEHEEKRMEEMKKEIAEERKLQELQMQAAEAGHIDKVERLEFMYKGGPMQAAEDMNAYFSGEKKWVPPKDTETEWDKVKDSTGALLADRGGGKNETWNKLNSDPLLMMRMQEQEARKYVTENPVRMAAIRNEVAAAREKKRAKKEAKKEKKREKKEARKREIREEVRRKVLGDDAYAAASKRGRSEGGGRGRGDGRRNGSASSSSSSSRSPKRKERRGRSRSRSRERGDRRGGRNGEEARGRKRSRSRSPGRDGGGGGGRDASAAARPNDRVHHDHASAQDGSKGYGLTYANDRAKDAAAVRVERRNEWRESTKDEREAKEEEARKAKEEKWARTGGRNNVGHKTGKLTQEEKEARLKAMMNDADAHDEQRWARLKKSAEAEAASEEKSLVEQSVGAQGGRHHSDAPAFLAKAQKSAFGAGLDAGGLEERIGTNKYYAQRRGDAGGNSYRRG